VTNAVLVTIESQDESVSLNLGASVAKDGVEAVKAWFKKAYVANYENAFNIRPVVYDNARVTNIARTNPDAACSTGFRLPTATEVASLGPWSRAQQTGIWLAGRHISGPEYLQNGVVSNEPWIGSGSGTARLLLCIRK
jgi:hypothetical protein